MTSCLLERKAGVLVKEDYHSRQEYKKVVKLATISPVHIH